MIISHFQSPVSSFCFNLPYPKGELILRVPERAEKGPAFSSHALAIVTSGVQSQRKHIHVIALW